MHVDLLTDALSRLAGAAVAADGIRPAFTVSRYLPDPGAPLDDAEVLALRMIERPVIEPIRQAVRSLVAGALQAGIETRTIVAAINEAAGRDPDHLQRRQVFLGNAVAGIAGVGP